MGDLVVPETQRHTQVVGVGTLDIGPASMSVGDGDDDDDDDDESGFRSHLKRAPKPNGWVEREVGDEPCHLVNQFCTHTL
jgi:hypothetical protein